MKSKIAALISVFLLLATIRGVAQDSIGWLKKMESFSFNGFGSMQYYAFDWQTDSVKRNGIDNERFVIELGYQWDSKLKLNTEIEIEHGGVGADVEFDRFEEFGEFEFDITKGGEVLLEKMNLEFVLHRRLSLQAGRVAVPFGSMYKYSEPTDYLPIVNTESESQILPENWTDNGLLLKYDFNPKWSWHTALVNGLDGSAFNSNNWIKRGNQRRFELANAENFAIATRLIYQPSSAWTGFISFYTGNTTGNRPKPDLTVSTQLYIGQASLFYNGIPFGFNLNCMSGYLTNSEALSKQNRNLSNNLNVKRTPVGSAMLAMHAECHLTVIGHKNALLKSTFSKPLTWYARVDYYDTMFKTEGLIFNNARWERSSLTSGMRMMIRDQVHIKTQYTIRKVGAPAPTSVNGGRLEKTFAMGFAFEF